MFLKKISSHAAVAASAALGTTTYKAWCGEHWDLQGTFPWSRVFISKVPRVWLWCCRVFWALPSVDRSCFRAAFPSLAAAPIKCADNAGSAKVLVLVSVRDNSRSHSSSSGLCWEAVYLSPSSLNLASLKSKTALWLNSSPRVYQWVRHTAVDNDIMYLLSTDLTLIRYHNSYVYCRSGALLSPSSSDT